MYNTVGKTRQDTQDRDTQSRRDTQGRGERPKRRVKDLMEAGDVRQRRRRVRHAMRTYNNGGAKCMIRCNRERGNSRNVQRRHAIDTGQEIQKSGDGLELGCGDDAAVYMESAIACEKNTNEI